MPAPSSAPPAPFNLQGPEISHRQQRMKGKEYASTLHTQRYSLSSQKVHQEGIGISILQARKLRLLKVY